jgi:hypothetical protein
MKGVLGSSPSVGLNPCSAAPFGDADHFLRSEGVPGASATCHLRGFLAPWVDFAPPPRLPKRPPAVHQLEVRAVEHVNVIG